MKIAQICKKPNLFAVEQQAESLAEEGIAVSSIPWVPRADG
jgi:hypothetical protein